MLFPSSTALYYYTVRATFDKGCTLPPAPTGSVPAVPIPSELRLIHASERKVRDCDVGKCRYGKDAHVYVHITSYYARITPIRVGMVHSSGGF